MLAIDYCLLLLRSQNEAKVIRTADHVFIHSPRLLEKKGDMNPNTTFMPNGVDFEAYSRPRPEPVDLASIPHPRIGYTGVLKKQLDWELLSELCVRRPD